MKIAIVSSLFISFCVLAGPFDLPASGQSERSVGSKEPSYGTSMSYEYEVGRRLGGSLSSKSLVFIGVTKSVEPANESASPSDDTPRIYRGEISLSVQEWLRGSPDKRNESMVVKYVSFPGRSRPGPWSAWENVSLQPGNRVLIVLWGEAESRVPSSKPGDCSLAVSEEALFPKIKEVMQLEGIQSATPGNFSRFTRLIDQENNPIVNGFLTEHLRTYVDPNNADNEMMALIELLSNKYAANMGGPLVRIAILKRLSAGLDNLSQTTREYLMSTLIKNGGSDERGTALLSLNLLQRLAERDRLKVPASVGPDLRLKAIRNYQTLILNGQPLSSNDKLGKQLNLRP